MAQYEVNIDMANAAKTEMRKTLATENPRVLNAVGAFSSLYDISGLGYRRPVLVLKTEEPGSKQLLAAQYDRLEGVCFDMINHLVNDCVVMGATPLTIQDAIICGKLDPSAVTRMVKALAEAARAQGCVLTGGETSEQPGVLPAGSYVLTSSIVGVVERDELIDGSRIAPGDTVLSLQSSGIHTNGYTLVRRILREHPAIMDERVGGVSFLDAILEPHRCYYTLLKDLFPTGYITGLAHITGGGICENLNRVLPSGVDAEIDLSAYEINPIFKLLRQYGSIEDAEMLRTFNCGCGLAVVCKAEHASEIIAHAARFRVPCYHIGGIREGSGVVQTTGSFRW